MVFIDVGDPKEAVEIFARAQWAEGQRIEKGYVIPCDDDKTAVAHLQRMLNQLEVIRPTRNDGKHHGMHTHYCECDNTDYATKIDDLAYLIGFLKDFNNGILSREDMVALLGGPSIAPR